MAVNNRVIDYCKRDKNSLGSIIKDNKIFNIFYDDKQIQ
jgi:hypothetical protein